MDLVYKNKDNFINKNIVLSYLNIKTTYKNIAAKETLDIMKKIFASQN